jgi:hypothetical protein
VEPSSKTFSGEDVINISSTEDPSASKQLKRDYFDYKAKAKQGNAGTEPFSNARTSSCITMRPLATESFCYRFSTANPDLAHNSVMITQYLASSEEDLQILLLSPRLANDKPPQSSHISLCYILIRHQMFYTTSAF